MPDRADDLPRMDRPLRRLPLPQLVRLYATCRDGGDAERMREVWTVICTVLLDRIQGMVDAFHFPNGERIPQHRRDDAAQDAYLLVLGKAGKLRGGTEGELVVALAQWVWNSCMDFGRRELRHDAKAAGSIDQTAHEEGGDLGRYDDALESHARVRETEAQDKEALEDELAQERELVAWGIEQMGNAGYREVLRMTLLEGLDGDQIAEELGISKDNVYARRSRGLKELKEILRDRRP